MGRVKIKRKQGKNTKPTHVSPPVVDRRALEKSTADVTRLLQEQEFGSVEEANAFLEGILSSGKPIAGLGHLDPNPLKLETNYLKRSRIFRTVHRLSPNRGKVVYLVGGAVRDSLLG
jgi:hypothetical protein